MEYQVDCAADGIATITVSGTLSWNQVVSAAADVFTRAAEAGCSLALFDLREADVEMSTLDIRDFAASQARSGFAGLKRALVVSARTLRDFTFYEHASRNLGQNMRVFDDIEEARAWLLQDSPAS